MGSSGKRRATDTYSCYALHNVIGIVVSHNALVIVIFPVTVKGARGDPSCVACPVLGRNYELFKTPVGGRATILLALSPAPGMNHKVTQNVQQYVRGAALHVRQPHLGNTHPRTWYKSGGAEPTFGNDLEAHKDGLYREVCRSVGNEACALARALVLGTSDPTYPVIIPHPGQVITGNLRQTLAWTLGA